MHSARAAVLLIFAGLSLLVTYPLVFQLNSALLGDGDAWLFVWNFWWWAFSLSHRLHPFCTDFVHYPTGMCAYLHTWNFANTWPSVILQPFLAITTLYNLFALAGFVLAAWGMCRFARFLGLSTAGSFLAGLAFSFNPYHFGEANGHLNLMTYQWIPFFFHAFLAGVTEGWTRRRLVIASSWLVLVGLSDWYYFLFCFIGAGLLVLLRGTWTRQQLLKTTGGALLVLALASLVLSPLLAGMVSQAREVPEEHLAASFSANLVSFFLPGPATTYSGPLHRLGDTWSRYASEVSIPWSVLLLSLVGLSVLTGWNRRWILAWTAVFWLLSLGPVLHAGSAVFDRFPLPYGWLELLPGSFLLRAPIRFHLLTWIGLALLYGTAAERLVGSTRRTAKIAGLAGLLLLETLSIPVGLSRPDISSFYRLFQEPGNTALIDLHYNSRALYYQTIHQQRILGLPGITSRQTTEARRYLHETAGIRQLIDENNLLFFKNSSPALAVREVLAALPAETCMIVSGYTLRSGELQVESALPHSVEIEELVTNERATSSRAGVEQGQRFLVRMHFRISEIPAEDQLLVLRLNGIVIDEKTDLVEGILPTVRLPIERKGVTCLFYRDVTGTKHEGIEALEQIRSAGFRWIVVPFYGNDRYVREVLGLTAAHRDRWLSAFEIP
jgi:hypothetical protein